MTVLLDDNCRLLTASVPPRLALINISQQEFLTLLQGQHLPHLLRATSLLPKRPRKPRRAATTFFVRYPVAVSDIIPRGSHVMDVGRGPSIPLPGSLAARLLPFVPSRPFLVLLPLPIEVPRLGLLPRPGPLLRSEVALPLVDWPLLLLPPLLELPILVTLPLALLSLVLAAILAIVLAVTLVLLAGPMSLARPLARPLVPLPLLP